MGYHSTPSELLTRISFKLGNRDVSSARSSTKRWTQIPRVVYERPFHPGDAERTDWLNPGALPRRDPSEWGAGFEGPARRRYRRAERGF